MVLNTLFSASGYRIAMKICKDCVGGGDMRINENSPRKWPNSHSQKLFLRIFGKWQNSILSRCSAITSTSKYTTLYIKMLSHTTSFKSLTVESITSSLQCITDTLKAARSEAATMSLF